MPGDDRIGAAARRMFEDKRAKRNFAALPADIGPRDLKEAYAVQDRLQDLVVPAEGPLAGWKIALTTPVMQRMVGINHPCAGGIHANNVRHGRATLSAADYAQLAVEPEIAVRVGDELRASGAPYDRAKVARYVSACMAAIEIVDLRNVEYGKFDAVTLVADNAMNRGCVLGAPVEPGRVADLATLKGRMMLNGAVVGEGKGADALGHPLEALAWIANNLVERGRTLRAGQVVLTGSIVATKIPKVGDEVVVAIDGLGEASLSVR